MLTPASQQESQNSDLADGSDALKTDQRSSAKQEAVESLSVTDLNTNDSLEVGQLAKRDENNNTIHLHDTSKRLFFLILIMI